jgi:hypothetical protein
VSDTRERKYVPHAITGEPVPVMFPEEQEAQRRARAAHPWVLISGWRCWCGWEGPFVPVWQGIGDGLTVTCGRTHVSIVRFIPETVGR